MKEYNLDELIRHIIKTTLRAIINNCRKREQTCKGYIFNNRFMHIRCWLDMQAEFWDEDKITDMIIKLLKETEAE